MTSPARVALLARMTAAGVARRPFGGANTHKDVAPGALDAAVQWLCRTHDVTGRQGSSQGFSLLSGWAPAFPETTGYVIGTLLERARATGDSELGLRALRMGDWEIDVQGEDGGVMQGVVTTRPRRSIVFNTGMVMHGWLDLHERFGEARHLDAARRGGDWLVAHQQPDGSWHGEVTYCGIPHTYNSRVAWALIRLARITGEDGYARAAARKLDWVVSRQLPNGWFQDCNFKPDALPNTHGMAYTMRGLLESSVLLGEPRWRASAERTAAALRVRYAELGRLPGRFDAGWRPRARWVCLTGLVQVGGVWLRLHQTGSDAGFLRAGLRAVEEAAGHQCRLDVPDVHGALPGSFPVYGRYAPLRFPNWATKFLADGLVLREACLDDSHAVSAGREKPEGSMLHLSER